MSVNLFSLPVNIQDKIYELKIEKIRRIIEFHYPCGKIEYSIYGIDPQGRNCCHIFSIEEEEA